MNYAERLFTAGGLFAASVLVGIGASSMEGAVRNEYAKEIQRCQEEQPLGALLLRDCIDEANAQSKLAYDGFEALKTASIFSAAGSAAIALIAFRRRPQNEAALHSADIASSSST